MSAIQRPRGKAVTRNGRAISFSIDALTHSRIVYAAHLISRALDVPASMATVVRAASWQYLQHLEAVAKRLSTAGRSTEKLEQLRARERGRVLLANHGGNTRWKVIPEAAMKVSPMPTWAELERSYPKAVIPLLPPESFRPSWMDIEETGDDK